MEKLEFIKEYEGDPEQLQSSYGVVTLDGKFHLFRQLEKNEVSEYKANKDRLRVFGEHLYLCEVDTLQEAEDAVASYWYGASKLLINE